MFEDIIGRINYTKLYDIHTTVAPIRGHNVWPLGYRRYSARHFAPRKDGSYELWYWNLSSKNITDPEKLSPLAVVHPDNTIEIVANRTMYQSDYWMLNVGMGGYALWYESEEKKSNNPLIATSVKYGGEYLQYINQRRLPLFKGMRWDLDTGNFHDDHGFTVRKWVVDRKLSDGIRKRYADQIKACKVMVRQFDEKSFVRFIEDVTEDAEAFVKPYFDKDEIQMHYAHGMVWDKLSWGGMADKVAPITEKVKPHVINMANKDLLGALYTYAIYKGVSGIARVRSYPEWALRRLVESGDFEFEFLLNKFFYELINAESAFKAITYDCNDPQASLGKWGCEIELANGSIVKQL